MIFKIYNFEIHAFHNLYFLHTLLFKGAPGEMDKTVHIKVCSEDNETFVLQAMRA